MSGPLLKGPHHRAKTISLGGNTLFSKEPSAITACSGGSSPPRRLPARIQCSAFGFRHAFLKAAQFLQQHTGVIPEAQSATACLWLQRISTTDACLTKMTLNEGKWQGT